MVDALSARERQQDVGSASWVRIFIDVVVPFLSIAETLKRAAWLLVCHNLVFLFCYEIHSPLTGRNTSYELFLRRGSLSREESEEHRLAVIPILRAAIAKEVLNAELMFGKRHWVVVIE